MLRAGYLEDWKFHRTYSGTPQGAVVSPILANIYLHELDMFIEKLIEKFNKGKKRKKCPEYVKTGYQITCLNRRIDVLKVNGEEYQHLIKQVRTLQKENRTRPSQVTNDPAYKRLRYCRYADDFILGVIGSKEEAKKIKEEIESFLHDSLKLEVSADKTGIRYSKDGTEFLGYEMRLYSCDKVLRARIHGRFIIRRILMEKMQLHIPRKKLYGFIRKNQFGSLDPMKPKHKGGLINYSDYEIISNYNVIMRGFANYYSLAQGAKQALHKPMFVARSLNISAPLKR